MAAVLLLTSAFAASSPTLWGETAGAYRWFEALCAGALAMASSHIPLFPLILALVPLIVGALSLVSAIRQLFATQGLIGALMKQEVASMPDPLRQLSVSTGLDGRVRVVESAEFHAFCFGWLRPQVCVSTAVVNELPARELEAVLRHESWHVQRRDPLRLLVVNALGFALFFMPVGRDLARHYAVEAELRADGATVRVMNDKQPLAGALYRAATRGAAGRSFHAAVGAFNAVDGRIDQLLGQALPAFRPGASSAVISLLVLVGLVLILCVSVMALNLSSVAACVPC